MKEFNMPNWMKEPRMYKMLKEKPDGITLGFLKFPILFNDTLYLLPKDAGDTLISGGWAEEVKPDPEEIKKIINSQ